MVLLLAIWLVHVATRRGLRPFADLARQVGQIHERTLDTRIDTAGLPVELVPVAGQLNGLMARLEGAFERERRFAANAAHELLTPVSELRAAAENAVQWRDDPAATQRLAEDTLDSATQMERLVRTLLSLASMDREGGSLDLEAVEICGLLRAVVEQLGQRIADRKLSVQLSLPAASLIIGNRAACSSILHNLLGNAVEYSPEGGTIMCRLESAGTRTRLIIANPNPGLEEESLARLWEPFWRRDAARTDRAHAGLGLALVRALATAQGFEVRASLPAPDQFQMEVSMPATAAGPT